MLTNPPSQLYYDTVSKKDGIFSFRDPKLRVGGI